MINLKLLRQVLCGMLLPVILIACNDDEQPSVNPVKPQDIFSDNQTVAYYPFDGDGNDVSGNGHHAEKNNATLTEDRFGEMNKAYSFGRIVNNEHQNIVLPLFDLGDVFSVSAWVKSNRVGDHYQCIVSKVGGPRDFVFRVNIDRHSSALSWHATEGSNHVTNRQAFPSGVWTHVAFVYNKNKIEIYESGVKVGSKTVRPITWTSNKISIGSLTITGGSEQFDGSIDDVLFIKRVLIDDEVAKLAADK